MKYSVKAAALATGVSESRLRTWERRYGIPKPARSASGRRQYDNGDIEVIRRMAMLVGAGIPASDAAAAALTEEAIATPTQAMGDHPLSAALAEAGARFDEQEITRSAKEAVDSLGWADAIDGVLLPALRQIGVSWHENAIVTANEHFTTEVIRRVLASEVAEVSAPAAGAKSVVLACPQDERHDVGLLALQLLLRQRGLRVYYLGADVPAPDLALAMIQTKADALCLAATLDSAAASAGRAVRELITARISARIFVGGPAFEGQRGSGVPGVRLPARVDEAARVIQGSVEAE
ncbi:MAG TPA: cobalamin-dependent protein [Dehalococcoidia bacterium]|nr:cobalamin-dependent protein [Dehalococcoidia bacterium]